MQNDTINILTIANNVKTLGPGNRMVIWVQGCPFNCKGCTTPEGIPMVVANLVEIDKIIKVILNDDNITGITFSGGEPFLQASKIAKIIQGVRTKKNVDVILFTGYEFEKLIWEEAQDLLKQVDLLIDGKYIEKLNDGVGLRGSSNQNLIYLSDVLLPFKEDLDTMPRNIDIRVMTNIVQEIGIPL